MWCVGERVLVRVGVWVCVSAVCVACRISVCVCVCVCVCVPSELMKLHQPQQLYGKKQCRTTEQNEQREAASEDLENKRQ